MPCCIVQVPDNDEFSQTRHQRNAHIDVCVEGKVTMVCCTVQVPDKDEFSQTRHQMNAHIGVCVEGKVTMACCIVQVPDKDEFSQTRRQMTARIDVCMGGKVAEEVIFGRDAVTSGARSDLQQATNLARHMITECGMSDELGKASAQQ